MSQNIRAIAFALVLVLAAASAAQALPLGPKAPVERGLLARVWTWVESVLSPPSLKPVWEREGSSMDPNGEPQNNNWSAPTTDEGSDMDPNGRQ
ncbi:MAG TPA: hypothetical protein VN493_29225 [Thermoanaerobaculia bacterium]|nr:hypothetical protein [Thermoanaerobaculia bacterium]